MAYFKVLSQYLPGGTNENLVSIECKFRPIPLCQTAWSIRTIFSSVNWIVREQYSSPDNCIKQYWYPKVDSSAFDLV